MGCAPFPAESFAGFPKLVRFRPDSTKDLLKAAALGQKRTWDCRSLISALPPKADIVQHGGNVRFVPEADISGGFGSVPER